MRWKIDDLSLDAEAYELRRDGKPLAVEPRVLDLLVYLVRHRQRVVSKDELLEEVWQGQHVGESALTRCVYEARRAVEDDADRQRRIKTVYGRGYQFVGSVEVATPSASEPSSSVPAAAPSKPRAARWVGANPWMAAGLTAVLTAVLAAVVFVFLLFDPGNRVETSEPEWDVSTEAGDAAAFGRLAIFPICSAPDSASDVEAELTALSLSDQLWVRLNSQPGLTVRSLEYSAAVGGGDCASIDVAAVAEAARVDAVLTGELLPSPVDGRLRLVLRLHETKNGSLQELQVGEYEVPRLRSRQALRRFVEVREAVADDVLEHVAPTFAGYLPEEGMSPHDPAAHRLYLAARQRFATITCGDASVLLDLLDRSLELDPEFAIAWAAKGFALYSQTWSCGRDASFAEQALEAAGRARELSPSLDGAVFLEATLSVEFGRAEEAFSLLLDHEARFGVSPLSAFARSYALRYAGFLDASERALAESLRLDPLVLREFGLAPVPLLYLGETERFLTLLPAAETPHDRYYRGLALAQVGRTDEALGVLEPAFRLNPTDLFGRFASALVSILEDDQETALEIVRQIVRQRTDLRTPDGEMTFKEAQLLAWAGDGEGAVRRLGEAVTGGFFCPSCIESGPTFRELRSDPRLEAGFHQAVEAARERHLAFGERYMR